ncbi:MAG TPA: CoA transferase [Rhodopila sp.]|uniref:CaiB/BaiF CoA-transferase family protein n=1 Tax=Rhodopila sp. TaxID=2480087 RepID=UPI002C630D50|nr:CoA transferase [Rhodopila sp.]HVY13626.1 CoA transferase [Rhodopila sp.]
MNEPTTGPEVGPGEMMGNAGPGMLQGLRVIEVADERAEYAGLLLAGLGCDVVKIEPPEGSATRRIGPFLDDEPGPERSLFFWNYNRNKKSVVLDIQAQPETLLKLLEGADILLDSSCGALNTALGLDRAALNARFPKLVTARMTPFGDDGPWADFKGSDLIHLALGGVMMNCGYDPDPNRHYDLPPIAPQVWHAYHIAGEQLATGVVAALIARHRTGQGQDVSVAVHEAVSKNPELDIMHWVMRRVPLWRLTCRHALEVPNASPSIMHTKDGRWYISHGMGARDLKNLVPLLTKYGMQADLQPPPPDADLKARAVPGSTASDEAKAHMIDVVARFARSWTYQDMPWLEAQEAGLLWAPIRKPHENALDEHWLTRKTFADVWHPEHGRAFRYPTSKWLTNRTSWQVGRRAPLLGEDTDAVLAGAPRTASVPAQPKGDAGAIKSALHDKPFPLQGVKILDFAWFLASAGGTRFLAAMGAESYKVEWKDNPDTRLAAMAPVGGREARDKATGPLPGVKDPDMGGQFNNKNAGKRGVSLNIRHPKGLQIAKDLVRVCDIVAEGFSPGVLQRLGLGYDVMRKIRPDIIYIQQAGMGAHGTYGRMRTVGPVAAAFGGQADMSGLPEPAMPVGWGYSYLDWMGAYGYALALLGALYHRDRTGEGQWIDASQCESGIFLTGAQILDWSANGRAWTRYGNRSPYKPAAPHGAYRCRGEDRWVAIACFTEAEWQALARVAGQADWLDDKRFATLADRLAHQDALDAAVGAWTAGKTAEDVMTALQNAGVPAGVCQNAEDRCDNDPQLRHLKWLTEVTGTKIGTWPVYELPMKLSRTPAYIGGPINRGAPGYGEDNLWVLTNLLGMTASDVERLAEEGVI